MVTLRETRATWTKGKSEYRYPKQSHPNRRSKEKEYRRL